MGPASDQPLSGAIPADAPSAQDAAAPKEKTVRIEIQALRCLAVVAVVLFHYWPELVPGGYVGVDVFFAISGFLITGHLVREANRRGSISLASFWARRARRILPAALLVLMFVAVATFLVAPEGVWSQFYSEITASTLYVENWYLAQQAVDYLGADAPPSPVQHYWTLSVEEQFYLVWPVIILIITAVLSRAAAGTRRRTGFAVLAVIAAASLAFGISYTASNPPAAFFITPTRIWEFAAGGLLAYATTGLRPVVRGPYRAVVSWLGLLAIFIAVFAYTEETPFPGVAAMLPVFGAVAVIWAGAPKVRWAPTRAMGTAPIQWVGDVSYSIYLWHWPLLILTPFLLDEKLGNVTKIALVVLTVALAAVTKKYVEDPIRSGPVLTLRRPRTTFLWALAGMASVLLVVTASRQVLNTRNSDLKAKATQILSSDNPCLGAGARDPKANCTPADLKKLRYASVPTPATAADVLHSGVCKGGVIAQGALRICELGVPASEARGTIVMIGDSHAMHWRPALSRVARANKWRAVVLAEGGCPFTVYLRGETAADRRSCTAFKEASLKWLRDNPEVDTLLLAELAATYGGLSPAERDREVEREARGFTEQWAKLPPTIKQVGVIQDNPPGVPDETLACVEATLAAKRPTDTACTRPRKEAVLIDPAVIAARRLNEKPGQPRYSIIDVTDRFCDEKKCYAVVGGVLILKDRSHMTATWSATLAPSLDRELQRTGLDQP
ncbi:MAG: acyltransferase [Acidobacteria bacterium]|nr:acyltransferase [Acidobacteriota bacterium]